MPRFLICDGVAVRLTSRRCRQVDDLEHSHARIPPARAVHRASPVPLLRRRRRRRRFELDALPRARFRLPTAHPPWRAKRQLVPRAPLSLFSLLACRAASLSLSVVPLLMPNGYPLATEIISFFFFLAFYDYKDESSATPHKALARQGGRSWARDRRAEGRVEGRGSRGSRRTRRPELAALHATTA